MHRAWQETTVSREYIWRTGRVQKHLYTMPGKRGQSAGSISGEQRGYINSHTLFLGRHSNQQGVVLENIDTLAPQPSVNNFVPEELGELVHCHISTAPRMRVDSFLQSSMS